MQQDIGRLTPKEKMAEGHADANPDERRIIASIQTECEDLPPRLDGR